jgi:glycosyltransferase involved in cell wall biosynthesis
MNSVPLVSISCITYNHRAFIEDCLESFLMQQTNFKFEVLIHDDCSTDGTKEIIEKYVAKYPELFFPIFQKENQYSQGVRGIMARFNFPRARGKYIALCEGDDYWTDPLKLQKQVDFLEENEEYAAIFHNAQILNEVTNTTELYRKEWSESFEVSAEQIIRGGGGVFPTESLMFRASLNKHYSLFPKSISGDTVLSLSLLLSGKFFYLNEVMSVYRVHSKGVYSEIILNNHIKKHISLSLSNIDVLRKYDCLSNGIHKVYVKDTVKNYYIKILRLRKIRLFRDFRYLIKIPIRDALYLIKNSTNSK